MIHWGALFAGIGLGSIIAAIVGWWSAKAVTISNHRQNWINALRDDLVTYLKEIDVLHYRIAMLSGDRGEPSKIADLEKQQDARNAALLVYRRILMRLNMTEQAHLDLGQALEGLLLIKNTTADAEKMAAVIELSRIVLKHEWAVTKYGLFTGAVLKFKTWRGVKAGLTHEIAQVAQPGLARLSWLRKRAHAERK